MGDENETLSIPLFVISISYIILFSYIYKPVIYQYQRPLKYIIDKIVGHSGL